MKIKKLLNLNVINNHEVKKITDNSSECIENAIYIMHKNNEIYLKEALDKGAKTIVVNEKISIPSKNTKINIIVVKNTYKELGKLLKKLYNRILKKYCFIGVTGTNGKTSTTTILYKYLRSLKNNVILIGSNGIYMNDLRFETKNTTPSLSTIYSFIVNNEKTRKYKKNNNFNKYVIIECSSQGIRNNRLYGLEFDIVGFTNITSDHLDYHNNISDYVFSKALLFHLIKPNGKILVNTSNCFYSLLESICPKDVIPYGIKGKYQYIIKETNLNKTNFYIRHKNKFNYIQSQLIGQFQVENILLSYSILSELNINNSKFNEFIKQLNNIPGRFEHYMIDNKEVIIDYAHTFAATQTTLDFILKNTSKELVVVVGSGGDRDRSKRSLIGKYVTDHVAKVIFTEDNNRTEEFSSIIKDITENVKKDNYEIIQNRFTAIEKAFNELLPNETLVVLGKGIEKTKINNEYFTDYEIIKKVAND